MFKFSLRLKRAAPAFLLAGLRVVSGFAVSPAQADDAPPSGYPSWQDVENAKQNASATAAEVDKINALLANLQDSAVSLGNAAIQALSEYSAAKAELAAASTRVEVLNGQLQQADAASQQLKKEAGALAAQSYKAGSSSLGIFSAIDAIQSTDSLRRLDLVNIVTQNAADLYAKAESARKATASLQAQQKQAEAERSRLSDAAQRSSDAAAAAQKAVEDQVAGTKTQSDTLNAQLASLNNTVLDTTQKYQQGVEAQREYEQAQQAKAAAAAKAQAEADARAAQAARDAAKPQPGTGGGTPPPVNPPTNPPVTPPTNPGGAVNNPAGAQAFASANLGTFGWGQDQFGCLLQLWNRESNWLTTATNPSSGAYGIPQSLPAGKMASIGADWLTNYQTQVIWGLNYIKGRYGSPCGAWAHSQSVGWY